MRFFQNCIEAFRDENIDVIISVGKDFDIKKLKNLPTNIYIFNSVPQLEVLKIADQLINANSIEELGIGKCLTLSEASTNNIKDSVFSVLSDTNIKRNITKFQELIDQARETQAEQK